MAYCEDHHTLVTASADMTLLQWYLDDIPSIKHYTLKSRWPTKHAAMSMCWSSSHRLLYSGTTAGTIQGTFSYLPVVITFIRRLGHPYEISIMSTEIRRAHPATQTKNATMYFPVVRVGYRRTPRNGDVKGTLRYRHGYDGHAGARQPGVG